MYKKILFKSIFICILLLFSFEVKPKNKYSIVRNNLNINRISIVSQNFTTANYRVITLQ